MSEMQASQVEAHTIVLHSLLRDVKHLLDWLRIGLLAGTVVISMDVFGAAADHDWTSLGFHFAAALGLGWGWIDTTHRAHRYRLATAAAETTGGAR